MKIEITFASKPVSPRKKAFRRILALMAMLALVLAIPASAKYAEISGTLMSSEIDGMTESGLETLIDGKIDENRCVHNMPVYESIYPVGSIYMSMNATSPATLFGGSWARIEGRMLLGVQDGGTWTHYDGNGTQATFNLYPSRQTNGAFSRALGGAQLPGHSHTGTVNLFGREIGASGSYYHLLDTGTLGTFGGTRDFTTDVTGNGSTTGNGGALRNLTTVSPYITVYMWERTGGTMKTLPCCDNLGGVGTGGIGMSDIEALVKLDRPNYSASTALTVTATTSGTIYGTVGNNATSAPAPATGFIFVRLITMGGASGYDMNVYVNGMNVAGDYGIANERCDVKTLIPVSAGDVISFTTNNQSGFIILPVVSFIPSLLS